MTPEAQRIAIAEACGWKVTVDEDVAFQIIHADGRGCGGARDKKGAIMDAAGVPNYLSDLNAMHEAEKVLPEDQQRTYALVLEEMVCPDFLGRPEESPDEPHAIMFRNIHATAAQRAEAFLRTLNLWKD